MTKTYIDYTKLINSSMIINDLEISTTNKVKNDLEGIYTQIISFGKTHDNCFSKVTEDNILNEIDTISKSLINVSTFLDVTVDEFSIAETLCTGEFNIKSVGLANVYKKTLKDKDYIKEGFDSDYYNKLLSEDLNKSNSTRIKTVMAALFIATKMPRLNYFWGGGHDSISTGINSSWGTPTTVTAGGDDTTGTMQPNSLDCSGYVSWALKNGGYNIESPGVVTELDQLGTNTPITEIKEIKSGDLASMDGHIGMVVNVENNNITVSHCSGSGSGINLTTIDTNTGLVVDDATFPERIGKEYFTKIVSIDYAN